MATKKEVKKVKEKKPVKKEKEVKVKKTSDVKKAETKLKELPDFYDFMDAIEKDLGLISTSGINGKRVSTTLAALDLIMGGGLLSGGWYTFSGAEQSSKTTLATTILVSLGLGDYAKKIPIKTFSDYEGSFSPDYFLNQARGLGFKGKITDIFGIVDPKTEQYVTKPIVRKYPMYVAEKFFEKVYRICKKLPDKVYRNEKWWLIFEDTKLNKKYRELCDEKKYKKTGKYWIETDNDYPQAVFVVDSFASMMPKSRDVEDANSGLAVRARMFAEQIDRVKGMFQDKRIILMGTNILRKIPMAMYGPSEDETGGTALKQNSDVRLRMTSRSSVFGSTGKVEKEKSVTIDGRSDYYRYVKIHTFKNKLSVPDLETWVRIWVRDGEGKAKGYDPVFDSWYFLTQIGACSGGGEKSKKDKLNLNLSLLGVKDWPKTPKVIKWQEFKKLILCDKTIQEKVLKDIGYKGKYFNLRDKILKSGNDPKTFDLFIEQESKKDKPEED